MAALAAAAILAVLNARDLRAATVGVSVAVASRVSLETLRESEELVVTDGDVARGYVEARGASRVRVRANDRRGYLLHFDMADGPVRRTEVRGLAAEAQVGAGGGWVPQPYARGGSEVIELSYRFGLAEGAQPGRYTWPVALRALPR